MNDSHKVEKSEKSRDEIPIDAWMIRSCFEYKTELHDCENQQGRRYQNYVYGMKLDCTQWKKDYENCVKFSYKNDIQAGKDLIAVEEARRQHRLKCARANDIWKYRRHPPEDWNAPLGSQKEASKNETSQNEAAGQKEASKNETIQNEAAGQKEAGQSESRTNETPLETVTEKSKCAVS